MIAATDEIAFGVMDVGPALRAIAYVWRAAVVRAALTGRWRTRVHVWEPTRAAMRSPSRALGLAARRL